VLYQKLFFFAIALLMILPQKVKDRRLVRVSQPMKIRLQAQTPARFALDILVLNQSLIAKSPLASSSSSSSSSLSSNFSSRFSQSINLNRELVKVSQKKNPLYILKPMRVSQPLSSLKIPSQQSSQDENQFLSRAPSPSQDRIQWSRQDQNKTSNQTQSEIVSSLSNKETGVEFSGSLELSGETALGPGRRLEVKWRGEQPQESLDAQVSVGWSHSGYQVKVPYLGGEIVAQIKDDSGDLIGEGRVLLSQNSNLNLLSRTPLKITSVRRSLGFRDFNMIASGQRDKGHLNPKLQLAHQATQPHVEGYDLQGSSSHLSLGFATHSLALGSSTYVRALDDNFEPMTLMVSDISSQEIPLISKKMANRYRIWLENLLNEPVTNVHLGRVWNKSRAQSGVEVLLETLKRHHILYLNEMFIPDQNLKNTASSGYFIVVNLDPGLYNLKMRALDQTIGFSQLLMEEDGYSYGDHLVENQTRHQTVNVFDIFTYQPESVDIYSFLNSEPEFIFEKGAMTVSYNSVGQAFVSVVPRNQDYMSVTFLSEAHKSQSHMALIPTSWFHQFLSSNRVNYKEKTPFILGFFESEVLSVETPFMDSIHHILYFDDKGEKTTGPVVGGGFVITELTPNSSQLIMIEYANGQKSSKALSVESGEVLQIAIASQN
jgi:hypothetical protein